MSDGLALPPIAEASRADAALPERVEPLGAFFFRRLLAAAVTLWIMATCVALGFLSAHWGRDGWQELVLSNMGERRWSAVLEGEAYRVLASTFLHRNGVHLRNNMLALFVFGLLLEPVVGARRMILAYISTGLAGAVTALFLQQNTASVGASGAVLGVGFVLIGARLRLRAPIRLPFGGGSYAVVVVSASILGGLVGLAVVARSGWVFVGLLVAGLTSELLPPRNYAHLAGEALGFLLGYTLLFWPRPSSSGETRPARAAKVLLVSAALSVVLASGSIAWALIAGRPWSLREVPPVRTVALPRVAFDVDLPETVFIAVDAPAREPDTESHFFHYGDFDHSPVIFSIAVGHETAVDNASLVSLQQLIKSQQELEEDEARRTIARVTIRGLPALRTVSEHETLVSTTLSQKVDGFAVRVIGYRQRWAAQTSPPAWDGIEERILASLRRVR